MSSALCEKTKSYVPGIVVTLGKCLGSHKKDRKDKNNDKYTGKDIDRQRQALRRIKNSC